MRTKPANHLNLLQYPNVYSRCFGWDVIKCLCIHQGAGLERMAPYSEENRCNAHSSFNMVC